jgi:hypothetical protein
LQCTRAFLSVVGVGLIIAFVVFSFLRGVIKLLDFWTALNVGLTLLIAPILYWGFRPSINSALKKRARPRLRVTESVLSPDEEVREIHVRLRDGMVRKCGARFFYITVEHIRGQAAQDLTPFLRERYPMILVPEMGKTVMAIDDDRTAEEFDEQVRNIGQEAFILAILHDRKKVKEYVDLRPENPPARFALFFTVEGFPQVCIPGFTHIYRFMPCTFEIDLRFVAKNLPLSPAAIFDVSAEAWDSFKVKQTA